MSALAPRPLMPTAAELFGEQSPADPAPALIYTPPDDDTPPTREGRALRHAVTDLVDREAQLREALADNHVLRELLSATMTALHTLTEHNRRKSETVIRLHEIIREYLTTPRRTP